MPDTNHREQCLFLRSLTIYILELGDSCALDDVDVNIICLYLVCLSWRIVGWPMSIQGAICIFGANKTMPSSN